MLTVVACRSGDVVRDAVVRKGKRRAFVQCGRLKEKVLSIQMTFTLLLLKVVP